MKRISLFVGVLALIAIFIFVITSGKDGIKKIDVKTLQKKLENEEITLLDVRESSEYEGGHIEGAVNAPLSSLDANQLPYPKDEPIYVICRSGNRSAQAASQLQDAGYTEIYDVSGGMIAWQSIE
ncbi:rhodanese-like domain-containing protein [Exiguobacterium profundum]|uniref:rhodanese-like domain-containing protein n=1 Tax=Exiguobacterium TaxID=33986 RepID=UPI001BA66142|nr:MULTISPECIES: rhodanese-like domain-containing protein [Exiguobacterium]MDX5982107.1 rhodanese-like domain-containing protein [Exiguobacterium profundum]QUP86439.1 rhodanese-like domain-containing protein [Exiguobacterium sp. PFWT01]